MDAPFDQTNTGLRERPVSGDQNKNPSQIYRTIRELARMLLSPRTSIASAAMGSKTGFLSDGFRVVPSSPAAMSVIVTAGMGFLYDPVDLPVNIGATDLEQVNDLSSFKPLPLLSPVTFSVPAAPAGPNTRIDIIEVRNTRRLEDSTTRRQLDEGTESFIDHLYYKTLAYGLDGQTGVVSSPAASTAGLSYKIGTAGNPGLAPAVTAGYTKLAEINVDSTTSSITGINMVDRRALLAPAGVVRVNARVRVLWNGGGGAQTATLTSVCAPPGVDVGVQTIFGNRGDFSLYVCGGQITGYAQNVTVTTPINKLNSAGGEIVAITPTDLGIQAVTSPSQAAMNTAGVQSGIGTAFIQVFNANGIVHFRDATGAANKTDAKLEDLTFDIALALSYN